VGVRQIQPGVPRDLETVCHKCLEKEPGRRYATAAELAEDLGRFLAGEPVAARPVGRWQRGLKWCRRNPAVAGLLGAVFGVLLLKRQPAPVNSAALRPEGRRLASAGGYVATLLRLGGGKIWVANTGRDVSALKGHAELVRSVSISPYRKRLPSASDDGTVKA